MQVDALVGFADSPLWFDCSLITLHILKRYLRNLLIHYLSGPSAKPAEASTFVKVGAIILRL